MKKIILLVTGIFCLTLSTSAKDKTIGDKTTDAVSTVYDDTKSVVSTVYTDGKDLLKTAYPEIKEAVIAIAQGVGVAAEHLYTVLVKKYLVDGIKLLCIFIIAAVGLFFSVRSINKQAQEQISWRVIMPAVFSVISLVTILKIDYDAMFMGIINPEYGAVNYILEYTKTLIK